MSLRVLLLGSGLALATVVGVGPAAAAAPHAPQLVSPGNGATVPAAVSLATAVSDPDGGTLDVTFYGRATNDPVSPFTIVVMGDTQHYAETDNGLFDVQAQWIADHRLSLNIAYVAHVGDCTENAELDSDWVVADAAMSLIEDPVLSSLPDGMPWGFAPGNHDQFPWGAGSLGNQGATTPLFNQYFGVARFAGRGYYGDHFGTNNDNHYHLFSASGMDFIVLDLEYDSVDGPLRQAVLEWADGVLKAHAARRAIVVSHYILTSKGPDPVPFSGQGQAIYDALKDNPNLFLMLSGHLTNERRRTDSFGGGTVHSLLADFEDRPNGGDGWLRLLEFTPESDEIHVRTFSPSLDQVETDLNSEFVLDYAMGGSPDFVPVGTANDVPSGNVAGFTWTGRKAGTSYEWRVAVDDGTTSTLGPIWSFTSNGTCGGAADCADGDLCTLNLCPAGFCVDTVDPLCCNTDEDCEAGPCTDDACIAHACQHEPVVCDDGNPCTDDACDPDSGCEVEQDDTNTCNDGLSCTSADRCYSGDCVGDDLCGTGLACAAPGGACAPLSGTPLPLYAGEEWRYFKGLVEPPAAWKTLSFHDASWAHGPSGFGYGDGDDATILDDMQDGYRAVYIRKLFDVPDPQTIGGLALSIDYDDAYVAYLNGVEIARSSNIAGNPPSHTTSASSSHEAGVPEVIPLDPFLSLLLPGPNVLAVQGHNNGIGSADFSLIPELHACDDGDPCSIDLLEPPAGCTHLPYPGASCDDGNACTLDDACDESGTCGGSAELPEVTGLTVEGSASTEIFWESIGSGAGYDVVGGLVADLTGDGGVSGAFCLLDATPLPFFADGRPAPPSGAAYYYLVRATTPCGVGPYGFDSSGLPELPAADCP